MATGRIGVTPTLGVRWSKAPTGGTTSLSGLDDNSVSLVYSVGYEQVYRNGVLLSRTNDYTATTGNTITLIDATITGDIIEVFANELVPLTDAISKGQFTAKGALLSATAASTPGVLAVGSNAQVLTADSTTSTGLKWATPAAGASYAVFADEKSAGTNGGTFSSGAWRTRDLATTQYNGITGASIASNQITLAAGTYKLSAYAPALQLNYHTARLYNITDSAVTILGTALYSDQTAAYVTSYSIIEGIFTIAAQKVFEIQHYSTETRASYGFGLGTNFAANIYTVVSIAKI